MENPDAQRGLPADGYDERLPMEEPDFVLEGQAGHLFRRAHQRARALFAEVMGESGITTRQFAALVKIREHGPVSQNMLGRLSAMDPATIQGVVWRLEARNLVMRAPDPTDRRRMLLRLTPLGERAVTQAIEKAGPLNEVLLMSLTAAEREMFLTMLKRLVL